MSTVREKSSFVFTGWHMAAIMVAFFGTVVSVNLLMAYYATTTWSGLVVPNTYVASQEFNGKTQAIRDMLANGITGRVTVEGDEIRYALEIPGEGPVFADSVTAYFKRPVGEHQDFVTELASIGNGEYVASHPVLPGHWIVEIKAEKDGRMIMHEASRIVVSGDKK